MVSWTEKPVVEEVQNQHYPKTFTIRYGKSLRAHAPNQTLLKNGGRLPFATSRKWLGNFLNATPAPRSSQPCAKRIDIKTLKIKGIKIAWKWNYQRSFLWFPWAKALENGGHEPQLQPIHWNQHAPTQPPNQGYSLEFPGTGLWLVEHKNQWLKKFKIIHFASQPTQPQNIYNKIRQESQGTCAQPNSSRKWWAPTLWRCNL